MAFNVLIPARHDATRLPGKPLVQAGGKPLIQWVYEAACESAARRVVIATDDERIVTAAAGFGAEACLTGTQHRSGTDRVCEAARLLGLDGDEVIVNLQGDEPRMPGALIDAVARTLDERGAQVATAAHAIRDEAALDSPDVVKVVCDQRGDALYFSRSRIPYPRSIQPGDVVYRHLGLYAYRFDYLCRFTRRDPTLLECIESLEQLRALEHGDRIAVHVTTEAPSPGIDTPADLERFRQELTTGS